MPGLTFGLMKDVILKAGFKPIPVDSDIESFQMSPKEIEKVITPKTGAILASHMFGNPCDIKTIKSIATKNKLLLIEDCAESLGATVGGKLTGTFGDIAFSSFNIAKPLQGIGGGLVFGNSKILLDKIRDDIKTNGRVSIFPLREVIRSLGGYLISQTFIWPAFMYLVSFDSIQKMFVSLYRSAENVDYQSRGISPYFALLTSLNLKSFRNRVIKRRMIQKNYRDTLGNHVKLQGVGKASYGNGYMTTAYFSQDANKLRRYLALRGIDVAIKNEVADDCLNKPHSNTRKLVDSFISLPLYENLTNEQVLKICDYIIAFSKIIPK